MIAATPQGPERRKAPRVTSQLLVKFKSANDPQAQWQMTPLKDLSHSGLRFIAEAICDVGLSLELQLLLPTLATPLRLTGRIVWSQPSSIAPLVEYGVEFTELSATQREAIDTLVTLYLSRQRAAR